MQTINEIGNFLASNWEYLPLSAALSLVMAGIFKPLKNQFNKLSEGKRDFIKLSLVFVGAMIATTVHYILQSTSPELIPVKSAVLTFLAQPWWIAVYKPVGHFFAETFTKAKAWDENLRSAQVEEPVEPDPALFVPQQ